MLCDAPEGIISDLFADTDCLTKLAAQRCRAVIFMIGKCRSAAISIENACAVSHCIVFIDVFSSIRVFYFCESAKYVAREYRRYDPVQHLY